MRHFPRPPPRNFRKEGEKRGIDLKKLKKKLARMLFLSKSETFLQAIGQKN